jgi:hypothetical protein
MVKRIWSYLIIFGLPFNANERRPFSYYYYIFGYDFFLSLFLFLQVFISLRVGVH